MGIKNVLRLLISYGTQKRLRLLAVFNMIATFYFISMNSAGIYLTLFQLIPFLFVNHERIFWIHYGVFLFFLLNFLGNAFLVLKTDCSIKVFKRKQNIKSSLESSWTKCEKCFERMPPRCHHCVMCNSCVLKRDHHCFFLSTCVGLQNEKYFILMTFYLMLGTIYTSVLIVMYINRVYTVQFHGVSTVFMLLPNSLFAYFFEESITRDQLLLIAMFYGSFSAGLSNAGLFLWQFLLAVNGQTAYEITAGIDTYAGKSHWKNFLQVFGKFWFISYLIPIEIPPTCSGLSGVSGRAPPKKKLKSKKR